MRLLGRALGATDIITSPTFAIHQSYEVKEGVLEHFDFYRGVEDAVSSHELKDAVDDDRAVVAIEWAQSHEKLLPNDRLILRFAFLSDTQRKLTLTATGTRSLAVVKDIK